MGPSRTQRGIGKFEFLLLVAMIGIFLATLMDRLLGLEREAERTEVRLTERNIQVGLRMAVGQRLMRGQEDRLPELLDANPVSFLVHVPHGYADTHGTARAPGTWRFDPVSRILSYRPRQPEAFDGRSELRWRIASQGLSNGRVAGIRFENLPD